MLNFELSAELGQGVRAWRDDVREMSLMDIEWQGGCHDAERQGKAGHK